MTIKNLETQIILRPLQGRAVLAKQAPPERPSEAFQHAVPMDTRSAANSDRPLLSMYGRGEKEVSPAQVSSTQVAEVVYQLMRRDVMKEAWRSGRGGR